MRRGTKLIFVAGRSEEVPSERTGLAQNMCEMSTQGATVRGGTQQNNMPDVRQSAVGKFLVVERTSEVTYIPGSEQLLLPEIHKDFKSLEELDL